MKLIDTHCHLCHGRIRSQIEDVLTRGRAAGLAAFICATGDLPESAAAVELARKHPDIYCTAGLHPHDAKDAPDDYLTTIEKLAGDPNNVAVGEIGLDYHYEYSPRQDQRRVFAQQLDLAARLGKKIVIHTREAFDDTMAILAESTALGLDVVFHSFTGGPSEARRALEIGATVSFSGIVTFSSAEDLRRSAKLVPRDQLLIETDCPFLAPAPVRKMRTNEPANVAHVAAYLAKLYGLAVEDLAAFTTANAARFFGLDHLRE